MILTWYRRTVGVKKYCKLCPPGGNLRCALSASLVTMGLDTPRGLVRHPQNWRNGEFHCCVCCGVSVVNLGKTSQRVL